jgi:5-formyltetrahydrofolate cyclo-ligase
MLRRRCLVPPTYPRVELAVNTSDILSAKAELRRSSLEAARMAAAALGASAGVRLADNFLTALALPPRAVVGAYAPLKSEIDPLPLLQGLAAAGHAIALPVAEASAAPLAFRRWAPGEPLVAGPHGTRHPSDTAEALVPGVLLVPLVAFDWEGYRLGRGGGFYDRTIEALRARGALLVVGCAFETQRVASLPREPHDQGLDWIVTEAGAARF